MEPSNGWEGSSTHEEWLNDRLMGVTCSRSCTLFRNLAAPSWLCLSCWRVLDPVEEWAAAVQPDGDKGADISDRVRVGWRLAMFSSWEKDGLHGCLMQLLRVQSRTRVGNWNPHLLTLIWLDKLCVCTLNPSMFLCFTRPDLFRTMFCWIDQWLPNLVHGKIIRQHVPICLC